MADRESFNEQYPQGPSYVQGSWANQVGRTLNSLSRGNAPGGHQQSFHGPFGGSYPPPPHVQGIATITGAGNDCPLDSTEPVSSTDAPCAQDGRYLCKFRYWDHQSGSWADFEEVLRLDASAYSPRPQYSEGDTVPAYFDRQRGWLVPIFSSSGSHSQPAVVDWGEDPLNPAIELPINPFSIACSVTCALEFDDGNGWRTASERYIKIPVSPHSGHDITGSSFTPIPARDGTKLRLVAGFGGWGGGVSGGESTALVCGTIPSVVVTSWGLKITAWGRQPRGGHDTGAPVFSFTNLGYIPLVPFAEEPLCWSFDALSDAPLFARTAGGFLRVNQQFQGFYRLFCDYFVIVAVNNAKPQFIKFALSAPLTTAAETGSGTVREYWGGHASVSGVVTLKNQKVAAGTFRYSGASGARGEAVFNPATGCYEIFQMECP